MPRYFVVWQKGGPLLGMPPTLTTMACTILVVIDNGSVGPWSTGWTGGLIENYLFHIRTSLFQLYVNIKQAFTSRVLLFTAATAAVRIVEGTLRGMYSPKGLLTVCMTSGCSQGVLS